MKLTSTFAILPAAGSSQRMGTGASKLKLLLSGKSVLERVVSSFIHSELFEEIIVLAPAGQVTEFSNLLAGYNQVHVSAGGSSRQESVWAGLNQIRSRHAVTSETKVMVHDAARCLVSADLIQRVLSEVDFHLAVTAAYPIVDTLVRQGQNSTIDSFIDRDGVWAVQTPQAFNFELLWRAHENATSQAATDDASLVRPITPVKIVLGEVTNLKLTQPADIGLFDKLLQSE